jgi:hypothetical protein
MFVVLYDLSDMPANHRTFLRQRTMYVPCVQATVAQTKPVNTKRNMLKPYDNANEAQNDEDNEESVELKSYLRYLIHLRFEF